MELPTKGQQIRIDGSLVLVRDAELIDDDTRVVVGHSLGSVVAYEVMCELAGASAPLTFGDIGRNGHSGATHLTGEAVQFVARPRPTGTVDSSHHRHPLLPGNKVSIAARRFASHSHDSRLTTHDSSREPCC